MGRGTLEYVQANNIEVGIAEFYFIWLELRLKE
jgi:hypothetical protein